jgi:hypothetical protein
LALILNFSPIHFEDQEISVGRLPYGTDGDETLKALRREHSGTHVFLREGAASIVGVPVVVGAPIIGKDESIHLKEHLGVVAALIRNALLEGVSKLGRQARSYEPLRVRSSKDLLRLSCPHGVAPPSWLALHLLYEISIRAVYFVGKEPFVAAIPSVQTERLVERTAAELIGDGMSLSGIYVGRSIASHDSRITDGFELLGRVTEVDGLRLRLSDYRDGFDTVDARTVQPSRDAFAACLTHVFGVRATTISATLEQLRAAERTGPRHLERIKSIIASLRKRQHEMAPGVPFSFGPLLDDSCATFPQFETAPHPLYVYDARGFKTSEWNDGGLNKFGPFSEGVGGIAPPRICVICQKSEKGEVDQFLRTFFSHGVRLPASPRHKVKPPKNYFEKGFCQKYRLSTVHYEYFLAADRSAEAYRKACQEALEKHGTDHPWDLALVQIEEAFHELPPEVNPYFVTKLSFQTLQILVQEFEIETARKRGSQLSFCLNNMGLATYAKLGGIPWLMQAPAKGLHEFVIGLGSAEVGVGRLGKRERLVGITTIFGGDGHYHLSNLSKAVPKAEYQEALLRTLRTAIGNVRTGMNWQEGDRILFVFHAKFKKFSDDEVRAVVTLISELTEFDVKYAFVQISEENPFIAFDTSERGITDYESGLAKGIYAPKRGGYLLLGRRDALLCVTGSTDVKRPEDGMPQPLQISLHRESSFTDIPYLAEQVYAFSCHSWRSFLPGSLPVTIHYSNLIAGSLGKLSRLERWNPDVMLDRIGKTMWFL